MTTATHVGVPVEYGRMAQKMRTEVVGRLRLPCVDSQVCSRVHLPYFAGWDLYAISQLSDPYLIRYERFQIPDQDFFVVFVFSKEGSGPDVHLPMFSARVRIYKPRQYNPRQHLIFASHPVKPLSKTNEAILRHPLGSIFGKEKTWSAFNPEDPLEVPNPNDPRFVILANRNFAPISLVLRTGDDSLIPQAKDIPLGAMVDPYLDDQTPVRGVIYRTPLRNPVRRNLYQIPEHLKDRITGPVPRLMLATAVPIFREDVLMNLLLRMTCDLCWVRKMFLTEPDPCPCLCHVNGPLREALRDPSAAWREWGPDDNTQCQACQEYGHSCACLIECPHCLLTKPPNDQVTVASVAAAEGMIQCTCRLD